MERSDAVSILSAWSPLQALVDGGDALRLRDEAACDLLCHFQISWDVGAELQRLVGLLSDLCCPTS